MSKIVTALFASFLLSSSFAFADYEEGMTAYKKNDFLTALKEWTPLAEQGKVHAQSSLGLMYTREGVHQNYAEATKWFRKGADQGDEVSQFELGILYENGHGVLQNYVIAYSLFSLSASIIKKGEIRSMIAPLAEYHRSKIALKMSPQSIEVAQKLTLKMAQSGNLLKAIDQYGKH